MTYHPDVLAAHAEFGGDLETMQALYDRPDHLATIARLRADNERLRKERDFEQSSRLTSEAQLGVLIENTTSRALAAKARAEKAVTLLTKASVALEQFAAIGDMLTLAGATSDDEIELSGEELRPALLAAAIVKKEIDAFLPKESADAD